MTEDEEVTYLWGIALTKKAGWQYSDFPVVQDSSSSFDRAWKKARKKKRLSNGEPVTVEMIERQWLAEAKARRVDRERKVFVPQPVGVSAYCNQDRWNNYLKTETTQERNSSDGKKCHCGADVHGPNYVECDYHLGFKDGKLIAPCADKLREYYSRHPGIRKQTREQAVKFMKARMREFGRNKIPLVWKILGKANKQNFIYKTNNSHK